MPYYNESSNDTHLVGTDTIPSRVTVKLHEEIMITTAAIIPQGGMRTACFVLGFFGGKF